MSDRRLRPVYVVPMAGGAVGAIVAAGIAAGVAISGGVSSAGPGSAPTTTLEVPADDDSSAAAPSTSEVERPAPLDVQVAWDGTVIVFTGVAQSVEQVDSLGPDAPGSVDVAGPGSVTADDEVAAFGTFLETVADAFAELQARLTVDSVTVTGVLAQGFTEDDLVAELADAGLGDLTQQLDVTSGPGS